MRNKKAYKIKKLLWESVTNDDEWVAWAPFGISVHAFLRAKKDKSHEWVWEILWQENRKDGRSTITGVADGVVEARIEAESAYKSIIMEALQEVA